MSGLRPFGLLACLSLLLTTTALSQFQPKNLIKHYSIKQGLSQGVVNSVVEDNEHIIWFATEDGLNRFDGYNFKVFKYDQGMRKGLSDNFIQSLFKDSEDTLWISSRKGLLKFDPDVESFTLFEHNFKGSQIAAPNDVSYITEGSAKNLWIAWYGNGLASFNRKTKKFTPYTTKELPSLSSAQTLTLLEDKFGFLWVGTQSGGVNVFKVINGAITNKIDALSSSQNLPALNVRSIVQDNFNNIWIGTSNGLTVYLRQQNRFYTFNNKDFAIAGKSIFSLIADSNENLWIGTQGHGLYQFDLRQFNTRQPEDFIFTNISNLDDFDISKKTMQCFYEDSNKNLWIGTFGDGAYMISSEKEKFAKIQTPLYNESAVSLVSYYGMCYDHEGNLWLGTDGNGLFKKEQYGKKKKHYIPDGRPGSIGDNAIQAALCDSRGRLWFGTYSNGIFLYNKSTDSFTHYRFKSTGSGQSGGQDVRVIFEDSQKRIWVGTNRGGLCLLDLDSKTYGHVDEHLGVLQSGDIRSIVEDDERNLWLGFYGDGLYRFNYEEKELTSYEGDGKEKLHGQIIYSLNFDRLKRLWIGTGGTGFYYYDKSSNLLKGFSEKDGLINNTVYSILIDNNGSCWISTNTGISKFDPTTSKFTNYQSLDGLQEGQYNPGSGLYNSLAGYMCFGGTQGLNIFYPEQMDDQSKNPKIMITGLQIFNKPVSLQDSVDGEPILKQVISKTEAITLNYDQSVITLEFVGLNYSYPEKNIYAYKLEQLDDDWNYVGHQRTATYRYLKPGDYTFKVKASNKENTWSDEYASLSITIKPPFWQTPLAYLMYVVVTAVVSFIIYRFSRKQLSLRKRLKIEKAQRKQDKRLAMEKLTFFTEISHEFRTPLTLIMGPLEELLSKESTNSPDERKLKMVHRNANKLLLLINKLLDYRKIESGNVILRIKEDNLVMFVNEIYMMFKDLAQKKNINFTFQADHEEVNAWFDKEKLEMVISNILSNSFKYIGEGNEISISVSTHISEKYPQGRAVIKVKDNGVGISKKQLGNIFEWFYKGNNSSLMSTGIGLSLAKKLVHLHKGEIYVESEEGKGSTFSIKIPMGKDHFNINEVTFVGEDTAEGVAKNNLPAIHEEAEEEIARKIERTVLIIEDDEEIRSFLKEYLQNTYKIFEATNGTDGLETAQSHHPDLIISDIMMPGLDGIELCRRLKENMRTSHIPIILLTAKTSLQHQKEGIETGADAYITKPFSPEILSLTISNLLKSRSNLMRFYRNLFMEASAPQAAVKEGNSADEKFLHTIYDLLKSNLDKPDFNINELAEVLNMSRSLVYKKVKMLTGLSPVEYIRSLRMQEAAKLLRTQRYKIFEVVYMVGFSDLKYFRKCFAKEFGVSPSDYIRQAEVPNA